MGRRQMRGSTGISAEGVRLAVLFERFVAEIKNDDLFSWLIEPRLCLSLPLLSEIDGKAAMTFVGVEVVNDTRVIPKCIFCLIYPDRTLTYYERLCGVSFAAQKPNGQSLDGVIGSLDRIHA